MAWRRRFYGRARSYFRTYGSARRSGYSRRGAFNVMTGGRGTKWVTFGAGAAAGYLAPNVVPYQDEIALVITAAPVRLPRVVRSAASGYVVGRIIRNIMNRGVGAGTGGNTPWL